MLNGAFLSKLVASVAIVGLFVAAYGALMPAKVMAQSVNEDCTSNNLEGDEYEARCGCNTTDPSTGNCGIIAYVVDIINVLSAAVGVVVVTMIAVGGVQYSMAKDNPQAAAAAKERIKNAILALVVYLFTYAFLQWLVPGGLF